MSKTPLHPLSPPHSLTHMGSHFWPVTYDRAEYERAGHQKTRSFKSYRVIETGDIFATLKALATYLRLNPRTIARGIKNREGKIREGVTIEEVSNIPD